MLTCVRAARRVEIAAGKTRLRKGRASCINSGRQSEVFRPEVLRGVDAFIDNLTESDDTSAAVASDSGDSVEMNLLGLMQWSEVGGDHCDVLG